MYGRFAADGFAAVDAMNLRIDADGRVIGVVSRGTSGCGEPVFGDVASRADWLKEQAVRVAELARLRDGLRLYAA